MKMQTKQQGITLIGMLFVVVSIGFICLVVLKITPVYIQHYSVTKTMDSLVGLVKKKSDGLATISPRKIKEKLLEQLNINSIYGINPRDIKISQKKASYIVQLKYDTFIKMFFNLDVVIHYDHSVVVPFSVQ